MTVTDSRQSLLSSRLAQARRTIAAPAGIPVGDPDQPAPLSRAQARLWFLHQLEPDSPAYHVTAAVRLRGPLDTDALAAAVRDLATRHHVLRTTFVDRDGEPFALLGDPDRVPVEVVDTDPAGLTEQLLACRNRLFRLDTDPPLRAAVFRSAPDEHVLLLVVHHIACDAWSADLMLAELGALYAHRTTGTTAPAAPALQYADFARWQAGRPAPEAELDWWAGQLSGLEPVLDLPVDRTRPAVADWTAGQIPVELPAELARRIGELAAATAATPFMVLLAAWQAMLARVCGTDDVAVGVPHAGRHHPSLEPMIGCFIGTLVLRADLSGDPTGRRLLARVRERALDAFGHAETPFERIVDRLQPERNLATTPIFQVLLNVLDTASPPPLLPGATDVELPIRTTKYDLNLALSRTAGGGYRGGLLYRADLFDEGTAHRLAGWFHTLLVGLVADPDRPVGDLPLEADLTTGPDGPAADHPLDRPLHELISTHAVSSPQAVAVVAADGTLDYAELEHRAAVVAGRLLAAGVRPEEPVAVLTERGVSLPVAMLGVLKAGAVYLPVDPGYPDGRLAGILDKAGARFVLTEPEHAGRVPGRHAIVVADVAGEPAAAVPVAMEQLAYLIFTSGSTGHPKGVAVEHRHITHYLSAVADRIGRPGSYALVSTHAADLGLTNLLGALTTGATAHLVDRETATDPQAFALYLAAHPVEAIKMVPSHLELLAAHGDLAGLLPRRLLVLAGEPVPWDLVERVERARPDLEVQVHYGPTETTVSVFACPVAQVPAERRHGIVPIGLPLNDVRCRVTDPAGRDVPTGVPGELRIGGPSVARGYLNHTDDRFTDGWYRSGDRVRVNASGLVDILGRVDDQVKIRGFRVELNEVATALREVDGVAEAVVLPVGQAHTRRLAAWITPAEADQTAVRAALRDRLPDYMVPATITPLAALPLTPNGKVDRAALPEPAPPSAAGRVAPSTPMQQLVAAAWAQVLECDDLGIDDDFFALGGDSFKAVRAVRAIDPQLRVIDLFTRPTVRELAAHLDGGGPPDGLLHRLAGPAAATLTVLCVPYGGGSAAAYGPFATELAQRLPGAAVLAVELPGHDPARPEEPQLPLPDLIDRITAELPAGPVLVYGHCVGSAAATELALRLESDGREVVGLVVGGSFPAARLPGRVSAWLHRRFSATFWTSDRAYRDFLRTLGGLDDDEGLDADVILRGLRHDVDQAQSWFTHELTRPDRRRLRAPVLCVIGARDRSTELYEERYAEWGAFADRVELAVVPRAGHYFLKHQASWLADRVAAAAADWRAGRLPRPRTADGVTGKAARRDLREFYLMAAGQSVSLIGAALSSFALGVWAYRTSGRVADYALVTMLALLPAILLLPLGGAVADRIDRRRIMLACNGAGALIMTAMVGLLAVGRLSIAGVGVLVGLLSAVTAFHRPAYLAAVAQLVPKPYLGQANALANLGPGLGQLIAPLAGGALIIAVGLPGVVAVDVLSLLAGLLTLLAVRLPDRLFRRQEETFTRAIAGGWRYLVRRRPLMVMIGFFIVENYLAMLALAVTVPTVYAFGGATGVSVVTACSGLGAGLGALAMVLWGGSRRRALGMVGFVSGVGLGALLVGVRPTLAVAAVGSLIWYASLSVLNAHWLSIIQVKVGLDLQGRVLATNQMLAVAMTPLAFLTAPPLAEAVQPLLAPGGALAGTVGRIVGVGDGRGNGLILVGCGLLLAVWGLLGLAYRPLRRMEDDLPDAVAGADIADTLDEVQAAADRRRA
ncbi:amino acid adenylation domain-containing protein [Catellatospora sp. KI3]|uniref:non-ribosomal peptide synthetase/MFS transporter n=1 Tax=Catellatospora sp. KI3 TaxID=3041620 RepID=UPI002482F543|nr:non-ribosomal peptide synthetase/MFS transporter [Catellatospora sp. KI3]MDI1462622.1 amino acid adenylation domain-containing protein [Catellatospora sp. KI3]